MSEITRNACDCCEGIQALTPQVVTNRPGLDALRYRVGTHAAFLATMKARLSSLYLEIPSLELDENGYPKMDQVAPLRDLTTRAQDDPSIALLDVWATVADVLTFYQERIANEGYLRTATERRSVLELARLVGYRMRPGVASSVYLAYTLEDTQKDPVMIPAGAKAQSVPGPGEQMQTFETSELLEARASWNLLKPRMIRPQTESRIKGESEGTAPPQVYLKGISTNLKPGDMLLIDFGGAEQLLYRIVKVETEAAVNRTRLELELWSPSSAFMFVSHESLQEISERFSNVEAFHVARSGATARQALELLKSLKSADAPQAAAILAQLNQMLETALANPQATRLQGWLSSLVKDLSETLRPPERGPAERLSARASAIGLERGDPFQRVISRLSAPPSIPPRNTFYMPRTIQRLLARRTGDASVQLFKTFRADLEAALPVALANTQATPENTIKVYALRVKASLFGHIAPPRPDHFDDTRKVVIVDEWQINNPFNETTPTAAFAANPRVGFAPLAVRFTDQSRGRISSYHWNFGDGTESNDRNPVHEYGEQDTYIVTLTVTGPLGTSQAQVSILVRDSIFFSNVAEPNEAVAAVLPTSYQSNTLFLDGEHNISTKSWLVIQKPGVAEPLKLEPGTFTVAHQSLTAYGFSGKATRLDLTTSWISDPNTEPFSTIRGTTVYAQSEELELAEEPMTGEICNGGGDSDTDWIELDGLYNDLTSGRWIIVSGERTDVRDVNGEPVSGVKGTELVMLADVIQDVSTENGSPYYFLRENNSAVLAEDSILAGDKRHTWIRFAKGLAYCYKRDAIALYGNVVKATHGETRSEVLDSGDASQTLQSFELGQPPLTYIPSPTPAGSEAALKVYVNDVQWQETESLAWLGPTDHNYSVRIDDDGKTSIVFGTGIYGARLPSGQENIKAVYRSGIGKPGNLRPEQITLLGTRPLGVKSVVNPMRASGGADRETRDQARRNAPLGVTALDRLVSVWDYAHVPRTFAGIGKAAARRFSDGHRELVHVTIAGADDIPIDETSDLYRNLVDALRRYGDPYQPFQVDLRELLLLVISANVQILPDHQWEVVAAAIRAHLLETFSFERRDLGQDVLLGEVISAIQGVAGVAYVDVDVFGGIPEKTADVVWDGTKQRIVRRLVTPQEIAIVVQELLDSPMVNLGDPKKQRLGVNVAGFDGVIHPAQLALLSPNVPDTLILNRIEP